MRRVEQGCGANDDVKHILTHSDWWFVSDERVTGLRDKIREWVVEVEKLLNERRELLVDAADTLKRGMVMYSSAVWW